MDLKKKLNKLSTTEKVIFSLVAVILFISLFYKLSLAKTAHVDEFQGSDAWGFNEYSKQFVKGEKTIGHYLNPGQNIFLAGLYTVGFSDYSARVIQILLSLAGGILIFLMVRKLLNDYVALIALLTYSIDPFINFYSVHFWGEHLLIFGVILFMYNYFEIFIHKEYSHLKFFFLCFGIAIGALIKSYVLAFIFASFVATLVFNKLKKNELKDILIKHALMIAVVFLVLFPWAIYNYVQVGHFIFTSTNAPANFYRGNNPYATIDYLNVAPPGFSTYCDNVTIDGVSYSKSKVAHKDDIDSFYYRNKYSSKCAIWHIQNHPCEFISKFFSITFKRWLFPNKNGYQRLVPNLGSVLFYQWIKWFFALLGIIFTLKHYKKYAVLYFLLLGTWFTYAITFYLARYKLSIIPIQIVFSSLGIYVILSSVYKSFFKKK